MLLFIIIDIAMQPAVPSDLLRAVPSDGEVILWSLISCVVLLLGRQLLLLPGLSVMTDWSSNTFGDIHTKIILIHLLNM